MGFGVSDQRCDIGCEEEGIRKDLGRGEPWRGEERAIGLEDIGLTGGQQLIRRRVQSARDAVLVKTCCSGQAEGASIGWNCAVWMGGGGRRREGAIRDGYDGARWMFMPGKA